MHQLRLLYKFIRPRWMLLLCLILVAYLAQMVLAQDSSVPEDIATPPDAPAVESAPIDSVPPPVEPIDSIQSVDTPVLPEPTQPLELIPSSEPGLESTIPPDVVGSPTPIAPVEATISPEAILTTLLPPTQEEMAAITVSAPVDEATASLDLVIELQPTAQPPQATLIVNIPQETSLIISQASVPMLQSHLSGNVHLSLAGAEATVTISGAEVQQTVAVQGDGSFALDVRPGAYQLIVTAQSHLPFVLEVNITDQPLLLPTITLVNTQTGAEVIHFIVQNFGLSVPPGPSDADINGDGAINIFDLAIAGSSLR